MTDKDYSTMTDAELRALHEQQCAHSAALVVQLGKQQSKLKWATIHTLSWSALLMAVSAIQLIRAFTDIFI